jgi:hypothetical protein
LPDRDRIDAKLENTPFPSGTPNSSSISARSLFIEAEVKLWLFRMLALKLWLLRTLGKTSTLTAPGLSVPNMTLSLALVSAVPFHLAVRALVSRCFCASFLPVWFTACETKL